MSASIVHAQPFHTIVESLGTRLYDSMVGAILAKESSRFMLISWLNLKKILLLAIGWTG